jgi:type II secretory pathway predicted ATPase ExeA
MYEEFYGLTEKPFSIQPDPSFIYWGRAHRLAYAMLEYGVLNHAGISVITGEVGCGKTTLIHRLLEQLSESHTVALLSNIQANRGDLLSWVLMGFGQQFAGKTHVELFAELQRYFIAEYAKGRRVVLIIDEAQNLTVDMLEELRMLSNINAGKDQLLQLILVGQPQLKLLLGRPDMVQLAQRVGSDFHLTPLSREEVHSYIEARLSIAGSSRKIFTEKAMDLVAEQSRGVPRVINIIADTALVYAFSAQEAVVDEETVKSVVRDKIEYGVFGLASSPGVQLSDPGARPATAFGRERAELEPARRPQTAPEPPRLVRAAPRPIEPEPANDAGPQFEEPAALLGGPSLYQEIDRPPLLRSAAAAARMPSAKPDADVAADPQPSGSARPLVAQRAAQEPRNAPAPETAIAGEIGVIIVVDRDTDDLPALFAAPEGARVIFVAPVTAQAALAAARERAADIVEIADEGVSLGRARNAGYRRLKKIAPMLKLVQFVASSETLDEGWLAFAARFMARRPEVSVLEGRIEYAPQPSSPYDRLIERSERVEEGEIQAAGATVLFRADAFEAAGGFRGDIHANETADLCIRLRRRGAHIWRADEVMAHRRPLGLNPKSWRARAIEVGHDYAAGAALHGGAPERFRITEQARAIIWGALFPAFVILSAGLVAVGAYLYSPSSIPAAPFLTVLSLGVSVYALKIAVIAFREGAGSGFGWRYGALLTLGHFYEFRGVARYWLAGRRGATKPAAS